METLFINAVLLTMLAVVTVAIVMQRNLFSVVILAGVYSFVMATVLVVYDAVDVAMTEAAVGAGISTVVLLATLGLTGSIEYPRKRNAWLPLFVSGGTGAALIWGTFGLAPFGSPDTPMNTYVGMEYLKRSMPDTNVPNVVTAVLADYRGYDTLGEVAVVFTAGIAIMLLLRGRRRSEPLTRKPNDTDAEGRTP